MRSIYCCDILIAPGFHDSCPFTAVTSLLLCGVPGQILQVVRAPNGAQYIIQQPQQQILLQQQMQPGGVQAPVIQQVGTHM